MTKYHLISTNLSKRYDRNNILLGAWCDKKNPTDLMLDYHWDNREKLKNDYFILSENYKLILNIISNALNIFHKKDNENKYWEIIAGPWLYRIIHTLYDRYYCIKYAYSNFDIIASSVDTKYFLHNIPRSIEDINPDSHYWNHIVYCEIVNYFNLPCTLHDDVGGNYNRCVVNNNDRKYISRFINWFGKLNNIVFYDTYIDKKFLIPLMIFKGVIPCKYELPNITQLKPCNKSRELFRDILSSINNSDDEFIIFTLYYISKYIPISYLEGLQSIITSLADTNLPRSPKKIYTSNAFFNNDQFQIYLAENLLSEFIFAQHGGAVGMSAIMPGEDHQVKFASKYISWGWRDNRKNIIPIGALSIMGKKLNHNKFGDLLHVIVPIRRFSFRIQSWPTAANQSNIYFNMQHIFIKSLNLRIFDQTVIRINKNMDDVFGTNYINKFKENLPNIRIDIQGKNIFKELHKYRLVVYSYNSTGYLELMALNYPVIIMWDEAFFELRDSSKNDFDELRKCGIMHDSPIEAAKFIESVWHDIDLWWSSDLVQMAVSKFVNKYAKKPSFLKLLKVI